MRQDPHGAHQSSLLPAHVLPATMERSRVGLLLLALCLLRTVSRLIDPATFVIYRLLMDFQKSCMFISVCGCTAVSVRQTFIFLESWRLIQKCMCKYETRCGQTVFFFFDLSQIIPNMIQISNQDWSLRIVDNQVTTNVPTSFRERSLKSLVRS